MRWWSSISTAASTDAAIDELSSGLATLGSDAPDVAFLFASPGHARDDLAARVRRATGAERLIGCCGGGIIGDGLEVEHEVALSIAAAWLPGASALPFVLESTSFPSADAGAGAWAEALGIDPETRPDFVILADPFTFDAETLVRGLDAAYPGGRKVGGLASGGAPPVGNSLFLDDRRLGSGAVGLAVAGAVGIDTLVAQGCRPIGEPMFATRVQRNMLYSLDGRPSLEALRRVYEGLSSEDRSLFRHSLFVGLAMNEQQSELGQGDFLIRNLVGADADKGAIAVGAALRDGLVVQFHLRDARASTKDLETQLDRYRAGAAEEGAAGALLFSCLGRGAGLYGRPNHDSELIRRSLGPVPLAGFFCNGEIGPVGGRTFLHGYTSSVGLFRRR